VQVNGQVAREPGLMLEPSDELVVEGRRVEFMTLGTAAKNFIYIMMHKPVQVVCTAHDPENRTTVLDLLAAGNQLASGRRVYPVGRLDYFSEGLLLLTDDGALAERLTHPRYHVPKRYELVVRTKLAVPESVLYKMRAGMELAEGEKLAPVEVRRLNFFTDPTGESRNREYLELTLHQGVNRQIRRMCRDLKLTVLRLLRVAQGPLKLGALAPGQSRELTATELAELRALVDL
jgi:23S rRNA pseudouridine2605 synthase